MDYLNMVKLDRQVELLLELVKNPYDRKEYRRSLKFWKSKVQEQLGILQYFVEESGSLSDEKLSQSNKEEREKLLKSIEPNFHNLKDSKKHYKNEQLDLIKYLQDELYEWRVIVSEGIKDEKNEKLEEKLLKNFNKKRQTYLMETTNDWTWKIIYIPRPRQI